jgi:single-stranded-DNA-specific exonuclease
MFEELLKCKNLLGRFGGHPMAAGLSLEEENIDLLRKRLNEICPLSDEDVIPKVVIDMRLPLTHITMKLAEELQTLEPIGKGNTKPLFAEKNIRIQKAMILGANQNVLKLKLLTKNGRFIDAVYFGDIEKFNSMILDCFGELETQKMFAGMQNEIHVDLVYSVDINEYMGNRTLQLIISSFRVS